MSDCCGDEKRRETRVSINETLQRIPKKVSVKEIKKNVRKLIRARMRLNGTLQHIQKIVGKGKLTD